MRILHSLPAVLISLMLTTGVKAQDETGLPGDHFSLEGALEMFKKAGNPGEFEKMLNTKENGVNNLDLNEDGAIDYIRVVNKKDGNVQLFVLQALVSASESQDIAVIELEKTGDDHAVIQIVGDEDIYGVAKIIEPSADDLTAFNDGVITDRPHGPNAAFAPSGLVVNVWFWPTVRFVFAPHYECWVSPWRWYHYPAWWDPWRPLSWHAYHPICYRYQPYYVVVHTHRIYHAPRMYRPMRVYAPSVYHRNRVVVNNYRTNYRNTPSRQFDSRTVNRTTPPRQLDNRSVNRSTPSRQFDRSTPQRQVNRSSTTVTGPRREVNRSSTTVTGPRGVVNRNSSTVTRPQREVNRSSRTISSPQREVNRNSRTISSPQREVNRSSRTISSPQREINRSSRTISSPQRQMNHSPRTISAPQRQMNRAPRSSGAPQRSVPQGRSVRRT